MTKKLRDQGYTQPIVALTANAVSGKREMFLANGFDEFISKPIDVRQLNDVLKKFIRNKQSAETTNGTPPVAQAPRPAVTPQLIEFFVRDASRTVTVLEKLFEKQAPNEEEEDIKLYTTTIHAMKSALKNVGKPELSAFAKNLEQAGHEKNTAVIAAETPEFIRELKSVIAEFAQKEENRTEATDEDYAVMREKLLLLKKSCKEFDKKIAKEIIAELRRKSWQPPVNDLLGDMAENLMSGNFNEVSLAADTIIGRK